MFGVLRSAARAVGPRGQLTLRPVSSSDTGTGIVIEAADSAGRPADLSALAAPFRRGTIDDLLLAERVLGGGGGGLELLRGEDGPDTARLLVRVHAPSAATHA
jgi:hypothetical protein